ncbi:glucosyltransferase domain-containing protein [Proteus sp. G2671]|uniref:glucosyltransferase domain-containing protein n=1 Tax=Proteus sp. G2671 TaxID=2698883 RepID=UPI001377DD88|nr:glucosyltransferase domain-containing protein [Proteus sp. G2671]NBM04546.1 hypothetical protein [Proteus sp. G2671]
MKFIEIFKEKWLIILSLIYILPIILANVYYIDDMGRVLSAYGWHEDGRIFATYIMQILSFGSSISQMFPLSILISSMIMLLSGCIISSILFENNILSKVCALLLLTSPFYLENLSYRYDSIPMSLSILLVVIPFIANRKIYFSLLSITCLTIVLGLYQTSAMAYFAVLICIITKKLKEQKSKEALAISIISFLCFLFSYLLYSYIIKIAGINLGRGGFININYDTFNVILNRLFRYYYFYSNLFNLKYIIAITPLCLISIFTVLYGIKYGVMFFLKRFFLFFLFLFSIVLLTTLPNLVLSDPWYTARTMICYPFIFYFLVSYSYSYVSNKILSISTILVVFFSFILSNSFGSVLKDNDDYNNFIAQSVSSDIMKNNNYDVYNVMIVGAQKKPIRSAKQYEIFPVIDKLAPLYMTKEWYWGIRNLSRYLKMNMIIEKNEILSNFCKYNLTNKTSLYSIYSKDDIFIIDFSNSCEK